MSGHDAYKKALEEAGFEPFQAVSEPWGVYALKDGSYLMIRANAIKIARQFDNAGNMGINVNMNPSVGVVTPKKLRGPPAPRPPSPQELASAIAEDDVEFTTVEDNWSEYRLDDGTIVSMKLVPVKVSRTNICDPNGEPLYQVNHQLLVKASLPEELRKKGIQVQQPTAGSHPTFIT